MRKENENNGKMEIDDKDKEILRILLKDSRTPITKMAKKVKMSHDAVKYRINRMKMNGTITSFTVVLDPSKIGLPIWGDVMITLWNLKPERYKEFIEYLKNHPYVAAIWNFSGKYQWFIEIYTESLVQFNDVFTEIITKFSDIIKDTETFFVLKEIKARQTLPEKYPGIN